MLITLNRLGKNRFTILWDSDRTPAQNVTSRYLSARKAWSVSDLRGVGCVCEGYHPTARRWPSWFWSAWLWSQHVKACPIPRNEYGDMI